MVGVTQSGMRWHLQGEGEGGLVVGMEGDVVEEVGMEVEVEEVEGGVRWGVLGLLFLLCLVDMDMNMLFLSSAQRRFGWGHGIVFSHVDICIEVSGASKLSLIHTV